MVLRLGESALVLVEDVIVGKRHDLDAARFQRLQQQDRSVELKSFRSARVRGRDWSFEVNESKIHLVKNICDRRKQCVPSSVGIYSRRRLSCRCIFCFRRWIFCSFGCGLILQNGSGLDHSLVRNHVTGSGKSDSAEFVRVGTGRSMACGTSPAEKREHTEDQHKQQSGRYDDSFSDDKLVEKNFHVHKVLLSFSDYLAS